MTTTIENEVRLWKAFSLATTLGCVALVALGSTSPGARPKFEEIDVERINIVEKDGKLRMVISNEMRQHPGIVNGKIIEREGPRPPGMIFFNHLGDEMGGLIFGENGGDGHFGSLTFDKVRNDQTIGFRHLEGNDGAYETGLQMWQQPNLPADMVKAGYEAASRLADEKARGAAIQAMIDRHELSANRLFLGKQRDDTTALVLYDRKGKPRIQMQVTAEGTPTLEFLDDAGNVTDSLPRADFQPTQR